MYRPADSARPADWVVAGIRGFAESVLSLVPDGFPSYLRVFHPALRVQPPPTSVTWAEVARLNHRIVHPEMQFGALSVGDSQPRVYDQPPATGVLEPELAAALADVLGRSTETPDECFFAVWEGFGAAYTVDVARAATFELPHRRYHLSTGSVSDASASMLEPPRHQTANLWWPADRAWCVATEIDLDSTYVGGDASTLDALSTTPGIEALGIRPGAGITHDSDERNV